MPSMLPLRPPFVALVLVSGSEARSVLRGGARWRRLAEGKTLVSAGKVRNTLRAAEEARMGGYKRSQPVVVMPDGMFFGSPESGTC